MPFEHIEHICPTPNKAEVEALNGGIGTLWRCAECDQLWTYQRWGYFPDYNWIKKERWEEITEWQAQPWYRRMWGEP